MKSKILSALAVIIASGLVLFSCDKIDEPYTTKLTLDTAEFTRTVLLEDYTGHTCVNCPAAAILSHNLKASLQDHLVVIAVHAGYFSQPTEAGDFTANYMTDEGTEWNTTFGITSYPSGMVNRKKFVNTHILSTGAWSSSILAELRQPATLDLTVNNQYNSSTRELSTTVNTEFLTGNDKNLKLIVVLTESGIISPQKNNKPEIGETPIIYNYEHNHMLRDCINGTWGTDIEVGSINETISKSFTYTIPANFNAGNCNVVAFVYDNDTKEVIEAAEAKVFETK